MSSVNANGGYTKPQKYVPGPGDPELPPQLSEFKDKTSDEILKEMNRMPFFMTKLDETDGAGGENVELEALKALAYEGEPHEIAENFKKQGNELYKAKRFKDARELYSKGLAVECEDKSINESLYANRAACELELKNYRRCIEDCSKALTINPKNVKCYYRTSKAFFPIKQVGGGQISRNICQSKD
ncbi:BEM_collapsed_G0003680.mRNA.1.CDS.1 [Saccharomyces cerevisiae]|nr:BEM_collapsed_G0003680.mRNA.1.CDS.1 [Saccharomyces cerevisiae]